MPEPLYRIHVVAQRVGLSEALIRAWERRYKLLKPQRTPGGYRAYSEADVALLQRVKEFTAQGISIGEAARLAPQIRKDLARGSEAAAPVAVDGAPLERWRDELLSCASAFDQARVDAVLDEALATLPPLLVFDRVLVPVLVEVGERWHRGELSVAEEHLVSQAIRNRLLAVLAARTRRGAQHVICACLPGEDHEVGLLGAALRFREAGFRVTWLGARTPADDLGRAVAKSRPSLVALAAHLNEGVRGLRASLGGVLKTLPRGVPVVVGGAAARQHQSLVAELGAEVVDTPEQWARLFRRHTG
jgi:MerR family transcriptional regulator, light-induced transcriptional regulator